MQPESDLTGSGQAGAVELETLFVSLYSELSQRQTERRGGEIVHVTLNTDIAESVCAPEERVIRVSEALDEIAAGDPRLVQVVEMRFFAGLTEAEIAASLGVTERTVRRDWRKARLLLSIALR